MSKETRDLIKLILARKIIVWPGSTAELQKALNLPSGKIFKVCKPSSKCCKIGLSKLKIRMNLQNESLFFSERRNDFWNRSSSINFFVMLVFRIHYVVRVDMKPSSLTAHFSNLPHG